MESRYILGGRVDRFLERELSFVCVCVEREYCGQCEKFVLFLEVICLSDELGKLYKLIA